MIGVTLRYKWITWAMLRFTVWSLSSHQGGYHKKCIHITWNGLPDWYKNTQSVVYYFKKRQHHKITIARQFLVTRFIHHDRGFHPALSGP